MRDFPTVEHVIKFVYARRPDLASGAGSAAPVSQTAVADAPAQQPSATSAAATAPDEADRVRAKVLAIVAEKTGYPSEMIDPALDLEADLGVDTVKQAETFAAVREAYGIPRDETLKLRDFPTVEHVINFVLSRRPDLVRTGASEKAVVSAPAGSAPAPSALSKPPAAPPAAAPSVPIPDPTASPSAPLSSSGVAADDPVRAKVMAIVAEKTGYPPEMIDPDLDLEADLGVDTVKQAETFAAVRAAYGIPREESLKLRDFPTVEHVIQFVHSRRRDLAKSGTPPTAASSQPAETAAAAIPPQVASESQPPPASLDLANAFPRRVPVPVLRPLLSLCKPTSARLEPGTRVLVMPDQGGVAEALTGRLREHGVEVSLLTRAATPEQLALQISSAAEKGTIGGLYWLPALDDEGDARSIDLSAWRDGLRLRVKLFAAAARGLYDSLDVDGAFAIAATRLGGLHGYGERAATAPMGGAVVQAPVGTLPRLVPPGTFEIAGFATELARTSTE